MNEETPIPAPLLRCIRSFTKDEAREVYDWLRNRLPVVALGELLEELEGELG